jgi:ribonucleotide reductase alpha subunit
VRAGKFISKMPARDVWVEITKIQANAGLPYIVSKDNINKLRNQDAVIYSSNLCTEVTLPTSETEIGVCNLASISVKKFLSKTHKYNGAKNVVYYELPKYWNTTYYFDYSRLKKVVTLIVKTMDVIIDINYYPFKSKNKRYGESNKLRRPIGIGIMGLADALCKLKIPFGSEAACEFRANVQEAIYYYALKASIKLAVKHGSHAYFAGHQTAQGNLHPLLYQKYYGIKYPMRYNWQKLAERAKNGVRHSVLTCCMPTGNTAMIMGNSACFEPYESNIYRFSAFAEELTVINKYLSKDIELFGLNNNKFLNRFTSLSGKIQDLNLRFFSDHEALHNNNELECLLKNIYRVASFEISPLEIINMAIAAQPYVDQSQSMNLFIPKISVNIFNYFYHAWKNGLKTLVYYTRSDTSVKEIKCTNCVI